MKKQIKDLELWEVDFLVAKTEGFDVFIKDNKCFIKFICPQTVDIYSPTTNPAQAWPVIDRERIALHPVKQHYVSWIGLSDKFRGKTSLESAMRCYIASKFGDEVEI
jgi:hypothetical protein